jgi:hypothetical protein
LHKDEMGIGREVMTDYDLDSKLVPGTKASEVLK